MIYASDFIIKLQNKIISIKIYFIRNSQYKIQQTIPSIRSIKSKNYVQRQYLVTSMVTFFNMKKKEKYKIIIVKVYRN